MTEWTVRYLNRSYWKTVFFLNWDRTIASISLLIGIVSLVVTLVLIRVSKPWFVVYRDTALAVLVFSASAWLLWRYARLASDYQSLHDSISARERALVDREQYLSAPFHHAHLLVHRYKTAMFDRYYDMSTHSTVRHLTAPDKRVLDTLCSYITTGVKESLSAHLLTRGITIGSDIAVSVKVIVPSESVIASISRQYDLTPHDIEQINTQPSWIMTSYRDSTTYYAGQREVGSAFYDIHTNTAFRIIIDEGRDHFLSNDLQSLAVSGTYTNMNSEWAMFYNAAAVVPIRYKNERMRRHKCYGLIAVDSVNPHQQDLYDEDCVPILCHAADLLATFFLSLDLRDRPATGPGLPADPTPPEQTSL